jgi:hypothetical protein
MSYDIHIEGIGEEDVQNAQFMTFGNYKKHVAVRGVHKLIVRFLKCFMTPKGTDLSDPEYGTTLMASFLGNVDPRTLRGLASQAVEEAEDVLRSYDSEYDRDDDERLFAVEIQDVQIDESNAGVVMYLRIQNVTGTVALVTVPMVEETRNG